MYVELTHRCKAFKSLPLQVFTIRVYANTAVEVDTTNLNVCDLIGTHDIGPVLLSKLRGMAASSVTDDEIRALETEALEKGDDVLLGRCIGALAGNRRARIYVAAVVAGRKREGQNEFQQLLIGRDVSSLAGGLAQAAFPTVPCVSVEVNNV